MCSFNIIGHVSGDYRKYYIEIRSTKLVMFWFLRFEGYLMMFHFSAYCKTKAHTHVTIISTLAQIITISKKLFFWPPFGIPKHVRNLKSDENYWSKPRKHSDRPKKKHSVYHFFLSCNLTLLVQIITLNCNSSLVLFINVNVQSGTN